jgi:predicted flap endonuclease-1-like 5' DNA nuclease
MFRKLGFRLLIIGLLVLIWWLMRQPREEEVLSSATTEIIMPPDEFEASPKIIKVEQKPAVSPSPQLKATKTESKPGPRKTSKPKPPPADDLKKISGIGPKIASVLHDAGITTFFQLAKMQPAEIKGILEAAKIRLANPETWPEQASREETRKQAPN